MTENQYVNLEEMFSLGNSKKYSEIRWVGPNYEGPFRKPWDSLGIIPKLW